MDTSGMKKKREGLQEGCGALCAEATSAGATTITAWRGGRCVRRAWSGSPGGISPGSAGGLLICLICAAQPRGSSRNRRGEIPIRSVNAPEKLDSDR